MPHVLRRRDRRAGTVALEFGVLSVAFIGFLMGIVEIAFLLYSQIALDYATSMSARQLLTQSVQVANGTSQSSFQTLDFCAFLGPLLSCSNIVIVLEPVTNYQTAIVGESTPLPTSNVTPGGPGSMMMLQAFYTPGIALWPLNAATLVSTAAFVIE